MGGHNTLKFDQLFTLGWGHRTKYQTFAVQENPYGRWPGGWFFQDIIPLCGSILQAETCQILSLAENPRWSPSVAIATSRSYCMFRNSLCWFKKIWVGDISVPKYSCYAK